MAREPSMLVSVAGEVAGDLAATGVGVLGLELGPFDIPVTLGVRKLVKAGVEHVFTPDTPAA